MRNAGVAFALAVLALAGCAENVPTVRWSKPAASYDEFVQDRAACASTAREESQPFYLGGTRYAGRPDAVESGLFVPCMAARGWHEDPKGFAAPPDDRFALWP
ncbi:MAG TPA: hypothetical protein VGL35_04630 [Rhizomicrobium sp.]|jgi:hypothetical protein